MTREEAITVLKAFMKNPLFSEVHKAAFNIAIHDIKAYQDWNINNLILVNKDNYEPTTKNNLEVAKAIEILKADSITGYSVEDVLNARDLAIKALEQEPTTKNDLGVDCISRIETIDYLCKHCPDDGECFEDCDEIKHLRQMPPVTPQPRRGHWVYTPQRRMVDETDDGRVYETDYRCSCSECGGDFGFARVEDSFCKYCGADMREVEE